MKTLLDKLKVKYPDLIPRMKIIKDGTNLTVEIDFTNPRYKCWVTDENLKSYVVGINSLHAHCDSGDADFNQKIALNIIEAIIKDETVAIGVKNKEEDFLIATMERDKGIKHYGKKKETLEIVSFTKEY
jgi:hypothetical protein